jgi:Gas vesicle synthesis protein GvpL/GvpF
VSDARPDRLVAEWAAAHAPELIARAQASALEVARERLQAQLVDALLAAAQTRLAGERRAAPAPDPPSAERVLWVYGVAPAGGEPATGDGVDGHPVRVHRHAGLQALVSDVPEDRFTQDALTRRLEDLESLEALARAHEGVLERAMAGHTVVPFRLCTIYSSSERLDAMLDREGPTLKAALGRLDGMQEWGVKAFVREPVGAAPAEVSAASGTDYLTQKRERRDAAIAGDEATEAVVAEIHARLTERASAAALSRPQDRRLSGRETEMILNAAYLVPTEGVEAFRTVVERLGQRHEADGIALELTGPWPPYHFVEPPGHDGDA